MNKDLGVWTNQDCALVLIDYQKEIFSTIRSETSAALAELNVRLLARTAKAFNMPIVLSTVGVAARINGPTQPAILAELPGLQVIDRATMNAFEDGAFREAVKKTGRKRLIFRGNPESDRRRWRLRWPRNRLGWLFIRSVRRMPSARPLSERASQPSKASSQERVPAVRSTPSWSASRLPRT